MNKNICDHHGTESTIKQFRKKVEATDGRAPQPNSLADKRLLPSSEQIAQCACGSIIGKLGAGRKPGESSLSCSECRKFIEYRPIEKLKRQRKRKRLTDCLEILADGGIQGDEALFILSNLGGEV